MSAEPQQAAPEAPATPVARRLGQICQGVIVGVLLAMSVFELILQLGNIVAFKYQGF